MTTSTATIGLIPRVSSSSTLPGVSHPKPFRQVSTVINQPLDTVAAYLRSATSATEGRTAESDPTFEATQVSWDRQVGVRYTLYGVPGGPQVTASIEGLGHRRLAPHDGHCSPGHQPAHRGPSLRDAGLPRIAQRVSGAIPCVSHETVQMKEV
jgi:hypothetical protein